MSVLRCESLASQLWKLMIVHFGFCEMYTGTQVSHDCWYGSLSSIPCYLSGDIPANTRRWTNVVWMLGSIVDGGPAFKFDSKQSPTLKSVCIVYNGIDSDIVHFIKSVG